MNDRDCDNCAHHSEGGCSVWECSYEQKEDDTISRQAAIDAVCGWCHANCTPCEFFPCGEIKAIQALPSAQQNLQQTCNNLAIDAISRQATIEAMEGVDWYHINENGQLTHGANSREDEPLYKAEDVYKVLNDMPSAQSDSCNGCKWENAFGYGECDHCKRSYNDMYEVENGKTT